jgi:hypothetical protein
VRIFQENPQIHTRGTRCKSPFATRSHSMDPYCESSRRTPRSIRAGRVSGPFQSALTVSGAGEARPLRRPWLIQEPNSVARREARTFPRAQPWLDSVQRPRTSRPRSDSRTLVGLPRPRRSQRPTRRRPAAQDGEAPRVHSALATTSGLARRRSTGSEGAGPSRRVPSSL